MTSGLTRAQSREVPPMGAMLEEKWRVITEKQTSAGWPTFPRGSGSLTFPSLLPWPFFFPWRACRMRVGSSPLLLLFPVSTNRN